MGDPLGPKQRDRYRGIGGGGRLERFYCIRSRHVALKYSFQTLERINCTGNYPQSQIHRLDDYVMYGGLFCTDDPVL